MLTSRASRLALLLPLPLSRFVALGSPARVRCDVVIGGVSMLAQSVALQSSPHIIVATPGRLAAHVAQGTVGASWRHVAFLVLDEADRLFEYASVGS